MITYENLQELENAKQEWYAKFDKLFSLVKQHNGRIPLNTTITSPVRSKVKTHEYQEMQVECVGTSQRWVVGDLLLYYKKDDEERTIVVSRAFEAKAFGDVKNISELFDSLIASLNKNKIKKNMAKTNFYKKGTPVKATRLNGETFLGLYEHSYDDGSHCVSDGNKMWYCKPKDVKMANEEEIKEIQETIIKPRREAERQRKAELAAKEEITVEDMEEAVQEE